MDSHLPDEVLVREAQTGNRASFEKLYVKYRPMVHGILLAHVSPADADDLLQNVFLRAMQRLHSLRETAAFGGWVAAIARREVHDHHRNRREVSELSETIGGSAGPVGEAAEVLRKICELPETYRETLMLRLVEGMTGPEIAERTGHTADSVRVNLCRGMKMLREKLG